MQWLKYDWSQRKTHSYTLLSKIRLGVLSFEALHTWFDADIESVPECKALKDDVVKLLSTKDTTRIPLYHSHPDMFAKRSTLPVSVILISLI